MISMGVSGSFLLDKAPLLNAKPRLVAFTGSCLFGFVRLRVFGVVRHWKRMWINSAYLTPKNKGKSFWREFLFPPRGEEAMDDNINSREPLLAASHKKKNASGRDEENDDSIDVEMDAAANAPKPPSKEEDSRLKNAATIGTALLVINSHRVMLLL